MSKILVTFFNGICDENNPEGIPAFYEMLLDGLRNYGNSVYVVFHRLFGVDFGDIPEEEGEKIKEFDPDICFVFNNSFYDLTKILDCPIVIIETDCMYLSNRLAIRRKPDRYYYIATQIDSINLAKERFYVPEKNIFFIPLFTEIQADKKIKPEANISFIGSKSKPHPHGNYSEMMQKLSKEEKEKFKRCILELQNNPYITKQKMIEKFSLQDASFVNAFDEKELLMTLSGEKRLRVLSEIVDLGLVLYGTKSWETEYCYDFRLNMAFEDKLVYSLDQIQQIYNTSKIGISVSHLQAQGGMPWRNMDIMASNACLVTDYHSDMNLLFEGVKIPVYKDEHEARELCKWLLEHENERLGIVEECQKVINSKYRLINFLIHLEQCIGVKLH